MKNDEDENGNSTGDSEVWYNSAWCSVISLDVIAEAITYNFHGYKVG